MRLWLDAAHSSLILAPVTFDTGLEMLWQVMHLSEAAKVDWVRLSLVSLPHAVNKSSSENKISVRG